MKILFVTTPQRETPSGYAPIGALSIVNYVRKHADDVSIELYNIDAHRPDFADVIKYISDFNPDILGISAVVSTAYAYTKRLTQEIKQVLPSTQIVVGGNLCASAEVLLRKAGADLCVIGEGEKIFLNVMNHYKDEKPRADLSKIPGLAYLDDNGKFINTGYETPLPPDEIWDVDWTDIERDGTVDLYFPIVNVEMLKHEGMTINPDDHRFDDVNAAPMRLGRVTCSKGCASRCTFCHRWDKGFRNIPIDIVFKRLDEMIERFNVGVVMTTAESFGQDRRWLDEFIRRIEPYNLWWWATGVRTSTVDADVIMRMRHSGCYCINYGNETGSKKMLEVMEKKVAIEDNYNAAKWTIEAGLRNTVQLVVGMPGESPETIRETIEYCKYACTLSKEQDPREVSINYAQALPGTPLYEFGRSFGLIGKDIDSEEQYLLSISDRNASDPMTNVNFTNYPRLTMLSWQLLIQIEVHHHYFKKFGRAHYYKRMADGVGDAGFSKLARDTIAAQGKPTIALFFKLLSKGQMGNLLVCYPVVFYRLRRFVELLTLLQIGRKFGKEAMRILCLDFMNYLFKRAQKPWNFKYRSLRKIVNEEVPPIPEDIIEMAPLRKGR